MKRPRATTAATAKPASVAMMPIVMAPTAANPTAN
jgi:hypothetical protein